MHINDLIKKLCFIPEEPEFPRQDVAKAIAAEKEITPLLITELEVVVDDPYFASDEEDFILPFYALALLGKFRCKEAFPVIIKLISLEPEWVDDYFSYFMTQGLSNVLASTYNGDLDLLLNTIMDEEVDEWARVACSRCLLTLALYDIEDRDRINKAFVHLLKNINHKKSKTLYENVIEDSIEFYPEEQLAQLVNHALKFIEVDPRMELPEMLEEVMNLGLVQYHKKLK